MHVQNLATLCRNGVSDPVLALAPFDLGAQNLIALKLSCDQLTENLAKSIHNKLKTNTHTHTQHININENISFSVVEGNVRYRIKCAAVKLLMRSAYVNRPDSSYSEVNRQQESILHVVTKFNQQKAKVRYINVKLVY